MPAQPATTVLLAVRDGARFLPAALDSVWAQTDPDFELLVVDDGSVDETPAILAGHADPRLRVLRNLRSLGLTRSLNIGLAEARGRFVARLDADDVCLPQRVEAQRRALEADPRLLAVGSGYHLTDERDRPLGRVARALDPAQTRWLTRFQPPAPHPTMFFRRLGPGGGPVRYDETFATAQDYELWSRLCGQGEVAVLGRPLLRYRRHPGGISVTRRREQARSGARVSRARIAADLPPDLARRLAPFVDMLAYERAADAEAVRAVTGAGRAMLAHDLPRFETPAQRRWVRMMTAGLMADALVARGKALSQPGGAQALLSAGWRQGPDLARAALGRPALARKALAAMAAPVQ